MATSPASPRAFHCPRKHPWATRTPFINRIHPASLRTSPPPLALRHTQERWARLSCCRHKCVCGCTWWRECECPVLPAKQWQWGAAVPKLTGGICHCSSASTYLCLSTSPWPTSAPACVCSLTPTHTHICVPGPCVCSRTHTDAHVHTCTACHLRIHILCPLPSELRSPPHTVISVCTTPFSISTHIYHTNARGSQCQATSLAPSGGAALSVCVVKRIFQGGPSG